MGYYRQSCSPYDVQSAQGQKFDFEKVKKRYEDTVPLRGRRRAENIRPINRRDRSYERIVKVSENEYYVTFDAWRGSGKHNKAITWCLNDGMETMTIHTPRRVWSGTNNELHPRTLSSSSVFWFYNFNMPSYFKMENHRSNKYVCYQDKYYSIELGDIVFQRKQGNSNWLPLVVHREFKHHLDRKQTKELRESIKPFMAYFDLMCDIVDSQWEYGNPIYKALAGDVQDAVVKPEQARALFKPKEDGSVPDEWLRMVERYKHKITRRYYRAKDADALERYKLGNEVCKDLFSLAKPCKTIEVPIGTLTNDRYKGWYR